MENNPNQFSEVFIEEIKRRLFTECFPRLEQCLQALSEKELWYRPNANSNSVGNISLHLCGNIRQWVIAGLGGHQDVRERQKEFDEQGPIPVEELLDLLAVLKKDVAVVLNQTTSKDLIEKRDVQIYQESGLSILVHVVEHFSYHVGQVTYIVKMLKDVDTGYYAGQEL